MRYLTLCFEVRFEAYYTSPSVEASV